MPAIRLPALLRACLVPAVLFAGMLAARAHAETLTVAVAANMQFAFEPLRQAFEAGSGHRLQPVISSSGKLSAQIVNGAPYDVFLSADMAYPEALARQGWTAGAPQAYAYGQLVLWTRRDLDLRDWPALLRSAAIGKIALADPKLAPYGQQSLQVLEKLGLARQLQPKLVIGESLAQVNQYIDSGAADIGFTARSVVLAPQMQGRGRWVEVPPAAYQAIAQGVVVLRHGQQARPALAGQFRDFLFSAPAQEILVRFGYLGAASGGAR